MKLAEKPYILALDLEGTLISNAMSVFPRPGLCAFLTFCKAKFQRVVIFTSVPSTLTGQILALLAAEGSAPAWFVDVEVFTCERNEKKDLQRLGDPDHVILVDDQEGYILPGQRGSWIRVDEFMPPYAQDDGELARVQAVLEGKV